MPLHKPGERKYEFKMSSFTSTMLNVLFADADQKGKTRNFRTCIGAGSDGSSADKLSLDLKFNPWDIEITFRPQWRSMRKTVFTHYDPSESWYIEQSDVWLDDVKTFYDRPMRSGVVLHPYLLAQDDTVFVGGVCLSLGAQKYSSTTHVSPDLYKGQACDVEQETEERNIQQRRIHRRSESSHVDSVDQHNDARSNDHAHGDSSV